MARKPLNIALGFTLLFLLGFAAGWLFNQFVYPGDSTDPGGACEVTDVGVSAGNPMQYALQDNFITERNFTGDFSQCQMMDTFDVNHYVLTIYKHGSSSCSHLLEVRFANNLEHDPIRTYNATSQTMFIVAKDSRYWTIYRKAP